MLLHVSHRFVDVIACSTSFIDVTNYLFDCFAESIMHLFKEIFRPLLYTIYEWVVYNEPPSEYSLTFM
ncbi:unnamed protein product [Adineta steineri]|uniref:Uncharacterized protein n=1 Tax=Adineta steineri TaxID=433720 RepID=A0A813M3X1_9BILA|nr:unnamed protein product [Adineta steineri]CAF3707298.1 unnamed protein product [Adineta steineri]